MIAVQAMAMAPLISDIPSPVVSDIEDSTPANNFVYPDAINLASFVSDDTSSAASIIWSFETAGTSKYRINGVDKLVRSAGVDEITPGAYAINTSVVGGEVNPDGNAATLTIRNQELSPVVGVQGSPIGSTDQTQLVTFFASDGTTASQTGTMHETGVANGPDVWFYTQSAGGDRLSGGARWDTPEMDHRTFPSNASGFTWSFGGGNCTSATNANGICINVGTTGDNSGKWVGPYGMLTLTQNKFYRIRANIIGSQSATGTANDVPLWDMIINNFSSGQQGWNLYGLNYFFLDNTGRANAATNVSGGKQFSAFWCPSPVSASLWNGTTGIFSSENASRKDAFIEFRILDSGAGIGSDARTGSLCLDDLVIETMDIAALDSIAATPYAPTSLTNAASGGNYHMAATSTFTAAYDANGITLTPAGSGATTGFAEVVPGDGDLSSIAEYGDDFPVPFEAQKLYLVTMELQAPQTADQNAPPDVFWLGADTPTNELICLTYVTGSGLAGGAVGHIAMPTTTAQPYKALFYSNYATVADTIGGTNNPQFKAFRPKFMVGNTTDLSFTTNTGAIRVRSVRVDEINDLP